MSAKHRRVGLKSIIAWLVLTASLCVMGIYGLQIRAVEATYQEGNASYQQLADRVRSSDSPAILATGTVSGPSGAEPDAPLKSVVDIPDITIDFAALKAINPDSAAWLYCPGTVIDYPVMRAANYSYYLNHLPDGTSNANGTLFIDYNCAQDFSDELTIIYGHHMKSGRMFGSLVEYKKQAYFDEHPYMYLYTERGNYRIDLAYGCVIGAGQWRERAFMFKENLDALLAYAAHNTTFTSGVRYAEGDRVVAMSTCSYEFDNARYVVIGLLRPEFG